MYKKNQQKKINKVLYTIVENDFVGSYSFANIVHNVEHEKVLLVVKQNKSNIGVLKVVASSCMWERK